VTQHSQPPVEATDRSPLVMIVGGQEWSAALESILLLAGYRVHRTQTRERGLNDAALYNPDAILIDFGHNGAGLDLCRQLVAAPRVGAATPLIVTSSAPEVQLERRRVLEAGAWELMTLPPAVDEMLARLATWVRAKRTVDEAREQSLIDAETGFYNARGLLHRATELASDAARFGRPLSCVVFTLSTTASHPTGWCPPREFFDQVRAALVETVRTCDTVGRLTATQFAVLAPATDPTGAQRLAERVLKAVDTLLEAASGNALPRLHAGYYGVPDLSEALVQPAELLARAAGAQAAGNDGPHIRIRAYRQGVLN
jgi:PleD family two-component response regulator